MCRAEAEDADPAAVTRHAPRRHGTSPCPGPPGRRRAVEAPVQLPAPPSRRSAPARGRLTGRRARRAVVAVSGGAVVVAGLLLVPLPGPGWPIVFVGLSILGREFEGARRVLTRITAHAATARRWWSSRGRLVRAGVVVVLALAALAPVLLLPALGG